MTDLDLLALREQLPAAMRDEWDSHLDRVRAVATDILDWTTAPLSEPALLTRLAATDSSVTEMAERYATTVISPVWVSTADLGHLVALMHDPVPGAGGARVRAGLGDALAGLIPPIALDRDPGVEAGWVSLRCGAVLLGRCPIDGGIESIIAVLREQAWRLLTASQLGSALTSFAARLDGAQAEWFARRTYSDEELTRAVRTMLRAGHPATRLPRLLRELAFAQSEPGPVETRIAHAVAAV